MRLTKEELKEIREYSKPLLDFLNRVFPTKGNEKLSISMTIELKETVTLLNANQNGEKIDIEIELPKLK